MNRSTLKNKDEKSPTNMADDKLAKDIKSFDVAYTCSTEDCKVQNNGKPYDYESNTYDREYQRKCPICGTMNDRHSGK